MITLKELFDNLTYGELSNVSIGSSDTGYISEEAYPNIVSHVNQGLTALHRRFRLKTGEISLQQYESISKYYLRSDFAQSNTGSAEPIKYLLDSAEDPFTDNLFKIEEVYDADAEEYPLNDSFAAFPAYTPSFDTLILSASETNPIYRVVYRKNHAKITVGVGFDPATTLLDISEVYLQALQYFIADRIYAPKQWDLEMGVAPGGNFKLKYEAECLRLEMENVDADMGDFPDRITSNGWV